MNSNNQTTIIRELTVNTVNGLITWTLQHNPTWRRQWRVYSNRSTNPAIVKGTREGAEAWFSNHVVRPAEARSVDGLDWHKGRCADCQQETEVATVKEVARCIACLNDAAHRR